MNDIKLTGQTPDIAEENIQQLKTIFPDVVVEGKVDFDKLQQLLGEFIDGNKERYNFTWNGKAKALRLAQTPSAGTLRPCKEESKDGDNTQNLYIEGDNLEVLKLLQKSYHGKVKMIYIDPPYNTGGDFVYPDNFFDSIENYKQITGMVDNNANSISTNSNTSGRFHTDWLNMIYPRLRLARNLLSDEGVIFISIGQDEEHHIIKICDELFGEENRLGICSRMMKSGGNKGTFFSPNIDYVCVYAKKATVTKRFRDEITYESLNNYYDNIETQGDRKGEKYGAERVYVAGLDIRLNQRYWIKCPDESFVIPPGINFPEKLEEGCKVKPTSQDGVWKWVYERYISEYNKGNIIFKETSTSALVDQYGNQSKYNIYNKIWLNDRLAEGRVPSDLITKYENRHSSQELKQLNVPFDFAKPVGLIKHLMYLMQQKNNDIVMDFFSGSATSAHAVMQLNSEDSGNRKFIMVQLPEPCDENTEAYKAGYKNICEIGKERIRRAGKKIKEEAGLTALDLDIGFKVFKLDSSNIRKWQPDYDNLEASLTDHIDNYVEGRTELDVVYEIILKCGLDLTYAIDEHVFTGQKVYSIGFGALMICLDDNITTAVAEGMVKLKNELKTERDAWKVVFKDNGFKNDSNKTNIKEILKCGGLDNDAFTTL